MAGSAGEDAMVVSGRPQLRTGGVGYGYGGVWLNRRQHGEGDRGEAKNGGLGGN